MISSATVPRTSTVIVIALTFLLGACSSPPPPVPPVVPIPPRPYMTVGFSAWLLLVPLAITSTRAMMRRLGGHWQRLHRLVYVAALLATLHFLWLVKADRREPLLYIAVFAALMTARVVRLRIAARLPRPQAST